MFEMFPGDYGRSLSVNIALRSGMEIGEVYRAVGHLIGTSEDSEAWRHAWLELAHQHHEMSEQDRADGFAASATDRVRRGAIALFVAQTRDRDPEARREVLTRHWRVFGRWATESDYPFERVEVPYGGTSLPGWLLPAVGGGSHPALIFYPGFDLGKEIVAFALLDALARRGVSLLVLDGPGIGEALWRGAIPSRPDYEVVSRAALAYLRSRPDIGERPIGVGGISLGGYYAVRSAAFEPDLVCCVSWGAMPNFGTVMRRHSTVSTDRTVSQVGAQLPLVMGCKDLESALARVQDWDLEGKVGALTQPILVMHGAGDRLVPLADAQRLIDQVPATDKRLRVFTAAEGGSEHVQIDEPRSARELLVDWVAQHLLAATEVEG